MEELTATGWIGADPRSGADIPFLLLYTTSAVPAKMRRLAEAMGLTIGRVTSTPPGISAVLAGEHVTVVSGAEAVAERPISAEWASIARTSGSIVLVVGIDPLTGEIDAYLNNRRTALGLLPAYTSG